MNNLTTRFANTVGRHFVTLSCVRHLPNDPSEKIFVFSGFVVDIAGHWFYITAGHILKDIRKALENGAGFDTWRLGDQTAGNIFKNTAIPYDFNAKDWLVVEDDHIGLDYAALPLRDLYRRLLEAGGVEAIGNDAWSDHLTEHNYWALVGIPSETVSYDDKTLIDAKVVVVPVTSTDEPSQAGDKTQNQFYAKLDEGSESLLKDVDGMSGGPVFSLKKVAGDWKYNVIGIQSGWYKSTRTLAACPFSSFGHELEEVIKESLSLQENPPTALDAP